MGGSPIRHSKREALNSRSGRSSEGRLRRLFRGSVLYTVLTSAALGVTMVPGVKEAAAQEQQMDVSSVLAKRQALSKQFDAIRVEIDGKRKDGFEAQVSWSDAVVRPMLRTLQELDAVLREYNKGQEVIPVKGTTDEERFHSLNKWLGRGKDAPLDADAMNKLEAKMPSAYGVVDQNNVSAQMNAVAAGLKPPTEVATALPSVAPPAKEEAPAEPEVAGLTAVEAAHYAAMADQLDVIAEYGTGKNKSRAKRYARQIRTQLESGSPDADALEKTEGNKKRGATQVIARAYDSAIKKRDRLREKEEDKRLSKISEGTVVAAWLSESLAKVHQVFQDAQKGKAESDPIYKEAAKGIGLVEGAYLLGAIQAQNMEKLLKEAADVVATDTTTAKKKLTDANALYAEEQNKFAAWIGVGVTLSKAGETMAAGLPDNKVAERMKTKATEGKRYLEAREQTSKKAGTLSFHYSWGLLESAYYDSHAIAVLTDMASAAQNLLSDDARAELMSGLKDASKTILDPTVNPLDSLSPQVKERLRQDYGNTAGKPSITMEAFEETVMRSPAYRYQIAIWGFYSGLAANAPELSDALEAKSSPMKHLANMRAGRLVCRSEFLRYHLEDLTNMDNMMDDARFFVNQAITWAKDSGMKAKDPILVYATARYKQSKDYANLDDEQKKKIASNLFEMAMNIMAIREAEIWVETREIRPPATNATKKKARAIIAEARRVFEEDFSVITPKKNPHRVNQGEKEVEWDFSKMEGKPTSYAVPDSVHPYLSRHIAADAVRLVAPQSVQSLDAYATYEAKQAAEDGLDAGGYYDALNTYIDSTVSEKVRNRAAKGNEQAQLEMMNASLQALEQPGVREARVNSRQTSDGKPGPWLTSAVDMEVKNLRLAIGLKGSSIGELGLRSSDPSEAQAIAWLDAIKVLSPALGRTQILGPGTGIQGVIMYPSLEGINLEKHDLAHDDRAVYPAGNAFGELYRQVALHDNENISPLLRHILIKPPEGKRSTEVKPTMKGLDKIRIITDKAAAEAGKGVPATLHKDGNKISKNITAARLVQLERRLSETRTTDGTRISDLAQSADPRSSVVRSAVTARDRAAKHLARYKRSLGTDLYEGNVTPKQVDMEIEKALASLSDDAVNAIPKPEFLDVSFYIPSASIDEDRDKRRTIFTAEEIMVETKDGRKMPLEDYMKANGIKIDIAYTWFMFQTIHKGEPYLLNPKSRKSGQQRYIGVLKRDITLTDGTTGDFVVRVKPSGYKPTEGPPYVPADVTPKGEYRTESVLFEVQGGTNIPILDKRLQTNEQISTVAQRRVGYNKAACHHYGADVTPVVVPTPIGSKTAK